MIRARKISRDQGKQTYNIGVSMLRIGELCFVIIGAVALLEYIGFKVPDSFKLPASVESNTLNSGMVTNSSEDAKIDDSPTTSSVMKCRFGDEVIRIPAPKDYVDPSKQLPEFLEDFKHTAPKSAIVLAVFIPSAQFKEMLTGSLLCLDIASVQAMDGGMNTNISSKEFRQIIEGYRNISMQSQTVRDEYIKNTNMEQNDLNQLLEQVGFIDLGTFRDTDNAYSRNMIVKNNDSGSILIDTQSLVLVNNRLLLLYMGVTYTTVEDIQRVIPNFAKTS